MFWFSKKVEDLTTNARICLESSDTLNDAYNKAEAYSKAAVVSSTKDDPDDDDAVDYNVRKKK